MNQGGEPGHDDYGLPRVDIQIPDDARELYRDVQAYHRELRALRRRERSLRWRMPLRRSGMIVPVIAGCLVLAMIAGMVLTMFSANPMFGGIAGERPASPGPAGAGHAASSAGLSAPASPAPGAGTATASGSARPEQPANHLPDNTISVAGRPYRLSNLTRTVLAIFSSGCHCGTAIRRLVAQATLARVRVYLVGKHGTALTRLRRLAPTARGTTVLAIDADNALYSHYPPIGLTVLFVDSRGAVTASTLRPGFPIRQRLAALKQSR